MIDLLFRGRRLVFESPLTPAEATSRLQREVAAPSWNIAPRTPTRRFEGSFADGHFRMVRAAGGRNSFRMMIEGTLVPAGRGVRVAVRLKVHAAVVALCGVLLAFAGPLVALAAFEALKTRDPSTAILVTAAFPVVFAVFALVSSREAVKAERILADLFEAQPSRPSGVATT